MCSRVERSYVSHEFGHQVSVLFPCHHFPSSCEVSKPVEAHPTTPPVHQPPPHSSPLSTPPLLPIIPACRLKDEAKVTELIRKAQDFISADAAVDRDSNLCRVYMRRIEHLYCKVSSGCIHVRMVRRKEGQGEGQIGGAGGRGR